MSFPASRVTWPPRLSISRRNVLLPMVSRSLTTRASLDSSFATTRSKRSSARGRKSRPCARDRRQRDPHVGGPEGDQARDLGVPPGHQAAARERRGAEPLAAEQPLDEILGRCPVLPPREGHVRAGEVAEAPDAPRVPRRHDQPRLPAGEVEDQHRTVRHAAPDEGDVELARVLVVEVRARDVDLPPGQQIERRHARPLEPDDAIAGPAAGARGEDPERRSAPRAEERAARRRLVAEQPHALVAGRAARPARAAGNNAVGGDQKGGRARRIQAVRDPAAVDRRERHARPVSAIVGRELGVDGRARVVGPEEILDLASQRGRQAEGQRRGRHAPPRFDHAEALAADAHALGQLLLAQAGGSALSSHTVAESGHRVVLSRKHDTMSTRPVVRAGAGVKTPP